MDNILSRGSRTLVCVPYPFDCNFPLLQKDTKVVGVLLLQSLVFEETGPYPWAAEVPVLSTDRSPPQGVTPKFDITEVSCIGCKQKSSTQTNSSSRYFYGSAGRREGRLRLFLWADPLRRVGIGVSRRNKGERNRKPRPVSFVGTRGPTSTFEPYSYLRDLPFFLAPHSNGTLLPTSRSLQPPLECSVDSFTSDTTLSPRTYF